MCIRDFMITNVFPWIGGMIASIVALVFIWQVFTYPSKEERMAAIGYVEVPVAFDGCSRAYMWVPVDSIDYKNYLLSLPTITKKIII